MATREALAETPAEKRIDLVRGLGAWASGAIVVGTMIGTGIFLKPSEMAREGRFVSVVFAAWIVGAILSLFGALSYAELGAMIPEAGGEYAYLRRGFGPVWGFLFGWMHSIVGRPSSASSIAAGLVRFLGFLVPVVTTPIFTLHIALPGLTSWVKPYDFVFTWGQPVAVLWLAIMTGVNYLGVRLGGAVQVFLTAIKIISVVIVIGVALFAPVSSNAPDPIWPASLNAGVFSAFLAALAAALWAYDGWEDLNLVGSEVKDPQRNFPRALVGGVSLVAIIYLLFGAACLKVLPFNAVASSQHIASDVVAHVAGRGAATWITLAMVISAIGSMNSSILSGARVPYAMARDGIFFKIADGIHPKYRTPARALIFQGVLASLMALTGTFEELTNLFIFAGWIFYGLAVVALFRMRRTEPNLPRPYRCWGYPWVPGIFVTGALALTVNIWINSPVRCSIGLLLILAGLPFYRHWHSRTATPQDSSL
ncbi:MAG: amino acid permease-associated region [Candidatus Acidoferrum typicum]|nr:amino acid permease-associated region [Candidatus Acidoferrum typicum]